MLLLIVGSFSNSCSTIVFEVNGLWVLIIDKNKKGLV